MFGFLKRSQAPDRRARLAQRAVLRVGIPRTLNIWNTHQFWTGFLVALGIKPENIIFSGETTEEHFKQFGKGRGTVDCCYPVKCMSGHYGELVAHKKQIQVLLSPIIYSLPSYLRGHVQGNLSCPRVMAGPENIKAGFLKEKDVFREQGIAHVSPFVSLGDPPLVPKQLYASLREILNLDPEETTRAVDVGYQTLEGFSQKMRTKSREILSWCARENKPCILVLARPYHMDSGIGHEIEVDLQANGYPILWVHYLPVDEDLMQWLFGQEIEAGIIKSPFDISDVWASSYSANTNEILWGAKVAARLPWITCAVRLSSYECGMDQPTYTPTQQIVERSGTLHFKFGDLDSTKPGGSIKIRVETIHYYIQQSYRGIIEKKLKNLPGTCPLLPKRTPHTGTPPSTGRPIKIPSPTLL
ncbi:MAG: acyl-CoA dehydratase activase-related protein [Candidatus Methylomirabilales bacterium]